MACQIAFSRFQDIVHLVPFQQWELPDGRLWTSFYRTKSGFLLRFPGLADFDVSKDGASVICHPTPEISEETARHLYFNQVEPLALSLQNKLVFHASAVEINDHAVSFVGQSRRGKSTLATSFAMQGHPFLTDDGLRIEESDCDGYHVLPSHPSVRLWDDSRQQLIQDGTPVAPAVQYTPKTRLLAADSIPYCDEILPLGPIYLLGREQIDDVSITLAHPVEAVMELINHTFLLDVADRELRTYQFDWVSTLVSRSACYWLNYPRRYDVLPAMHDAIRKHVSVCLSV